MTDVRLTATNPEDSSVVPVACNSKGELLVTEPMIEMIDNDITINGIITTNFSAGDPATDFRFRVAGEEGIEIWSPSLEQYTHRFHTNGIARHKRSGATTNKEIVLCSSGLAIRVYDDSGNQSYGLDWDGKTTASAYLIALEPDNPAHYVNEDQGLEELEASKYKGPTLDVGSELQFLREQLRQTMERLKMTPDGGWEVWDGSA
jgi:hypothetical protein